MLFVLEKPHPTVVLFCLKRSPGTQFRKTRLGTAVPSRSAGLVPVDVVVLQDSGHGAYNYHHLQRPRFVEDVTRDDDLRPSSGRLGRRGVSGETDAPNAAREAARGTAEEDGCVGSIQRLPPSS